MKNIIKYWAYFGIKNWKDIYGDEATPTYHATKNYPPAFITDSNTISFEKDGKEFADTLRKKQVAVDEYFIPLTEGRAGHEYQFKMNKPVAMESFKKALDFLKKNSNQVFSKKQ